MRVRRASPCYYPHLLHYAELLGEAAGNNRQELLARTAEGDERLRLALEELLRRNT